MSKLKTKPFTTLEGLAAVLRAITATVERMRREPGWRPPRPR